VLEKMKNSKKIHFFPLVFLSFILILSLTLFPSFSAQPVKFTEEEKQILEEGKLLKKPVNPNQSSGYRGGKSYILIEDDIEVCYRAMTDLKNYYYFYDDTLIEASILKKEQNKMLIKMVYGKGPIKTKYHAWYTMLPGQHTIKYKVEPNLQNDLRDGYGYLKFSKYDDKRVLMTNVVMVDFSDNILWKLLGNKITTGMMRLPEYLKRFLKTPESKKYRK